MKLYKVIAISVFTITLISGGLALYDWYIDREQVMEEELIAYEREQYEINKAYLAEQKRIKKQEDERIAGLTVFGKINEGRPVKALFIMNDKVIHGEEVVGDVSWDMEVQQQLFDNYGSKIHVDLLSTNNNSIAWVWSRYMTLLAEEKYDLIFMDLGSVDQSLISNELFGYYYEAMVREMLGDSDTIIVPIIGRELVNEGFIEQIKLLGSYYSLEVIEIEVLSGLESANHEGANTFVENYQGYADRIVHWVEGHINDYSISQETREEELYKESKRLRNARINMNPSDSFGFTRENSRVLSESIDASISYETNAKYNHLHYMIHPNGAVLGIYIDNELYKEIDTYNAFESVATEVIINEEHEEWILSIRLESKQSGSDYIELHSIVSN